MKALFSESNPIRGRGKKAVIFQPFRDANEMKKLLKASSKKGEEEIGKENTLSFMPSEYAL